METPPGRARPPTGTVTFLFTDVEGSTRLWEAYPEAMRLALARHDALLARALARHGGHVFKTVGDAFCAAFASAPDALRACLDVQAALADDHRDRPDLLPLPLKVRVALHAGVAHERGGDYFGPTLNRIARLLAVGHGGQVLLSAAAQELCRDHLPEGAALADLGQHRLKDLTRAEQVYQLLHPDLDAEFPALKSLDVARHNLPVQPTSFVGREAEMETVAALLERARLVTLTGAGGSGKTRLALQIGGESVGEGGRFPDGVWMVDLAPVVEAAGVGAALARALGVSESAGRSAEDEALAFLATRRLLLLLDNCEHLTDASARLADRVLHACPGVVLLATSREPLGIPGETVYRVPSLAVPDPDDADARSSASALTRYESVHLFIDRARDAAPGFALTDANAAAVAALCWRLDGIPLALELAAARVRSLPVEEIARRLDDRFRLLTSGNRAALPRQQTLRAAMDWSYDLLSAPEKVLLARLSVFVGGWDLNAAESVCGYDPLEPWDAVDLLSHLVDKSLVVAGDDGVRYRLLETVRAYGVERRGGWEAGEDEALRLRHRDYFLSVVEAVSQDAIYRLSGQVPDWLKVLDRERANVEEAMSFTCDRFDRGAESGETLARFFVLWQYWYYRASLRDGLAWMDRIIAAAGSEPALFPVRLGEVTAGKALLLQLSVRLDESRATIERALDLFRQAGSAARVAFAASTLAEVVHEAGDNLRAIALAEEALVLARQSGTREVEGKSRNCLGLVSVAEGDYGQAVAHYEAAEPCSEEPAFRAMNWLNRAEAHLFLGRTDAARSLYVRAMRAAAALGYKAVEVMAADGLAQVLADSKCYEDAELLLAASDAARERHAYPRTPEQSPFYEQTVAAVTAHLDAAARQEAARRGRSLSLADAFAVVALRLPPGDGAGPAAEGEPEP